MLITVGNHFCIVWKWWTPSIFVFCLFPPEKIDTNSEKCIEYGKYCSDRQINKPQCGHPKRAELPDVNINTGVQSINTEEPL